MEELYNIKQEQYPSAPALQLSEIRTETGELMYSLISYLGRNTIGAIRQMGRILILPLKAFMWMMLPPYRVKEIIIKHMELVGSNRYL